MSNNRLGPETCYVEQNNQASQPRRRVALATRWTPRVNAPIRGLQLCVLQRSLMLVYAFSMYFFKLAFTVSSSQGNPCIFWKRRIRCKGTLISYELKVVESKCKTHTWDNWYSVEGSLNSTKNNRFSLKFYHVIPTLVETHLNFMWKLCSSTRKDGKMKQRALYDMQKMSPYFARDSISPEPIRSS